MNETQNKTQSKKTPTCMDKLRECLCFVFCCKKEQKIKHKDLDANTLMAGILTNNSFINIKAPDFDVSKLNGCSTITLDIDSHSRSAFLSTPPKNPILNNLLDSDNIENKLLPTPMQHDIAQESTAQQSMSQRILRQLKEKRKEQEQEQEQEKPPQLLLAYEAFNKEDNKPNNEPNDELGQ